MYRRLLGAAAIVLALGGSPAEAARRVQCRDGVERVAQPGACSFHGGVARVLPSRSEPLGPAPLARCRDGTLARHRYRACRYHGGVVRWL